MSLLKAAATDRGHHAPVKNTASDSWKFDPAADPRHVAHMAAKAEPVA